MKFSELKYERPDFKKYQEELNNIAEKIVNAANADEVFEAYDEYCNIEAEYGEVMTISLIRAYQDSTDEFYNGEMGYNLSEDAKLDRNVVFKALLDCPFRKEIDEKYGSQLLRIIEKNASLTKEAAEERCKLAELENKYQTLKATIKFEYNGEILSEGEIRKLRQSEDREVRKEATYIFYKTFADKRDEFMSILREMVRLRNKISKANGYDTYLEYMDVEKGRYTYGEKELTNLCELVKEKLVPIAKKLYENIKNDLGLDSYKLCDYGIYSKEGVLTTSGNAKEILGQGRDMYRDLSDDMYKLYDSMIEEEFFDCESSTNKIAGIGFATNLLKSKKAFVFANFNGTVDSDIAVVTHEFGHAYQMSNTMKKVDVYDYINMPNDLAEIPSKTMEQLSHDYAEVFFKGRGEQYIKEHKIALLEEILGYCRTHEFETFLYTNEDATEEEIIKRYMELDEIYSGGLDTLDEKEFLEQGASLYINMGLYMFPRYLISYVLSDITAIMIKKIYDDNKEEGLRLYKELCELGGTLEYSDAMKYLGLQLAYTEEAVEVARESFMELLNE